MATTPRFLPPARLRGRGIKMGSVEKENTTVTWLSLPELADYLKTDLRTVRSQLRDARFLAVRRGENNALYADAGQFVMKDGQRVPLPSLRGTIISLHDAGYNDDEAQEWLRRFEPELRDTPLGALIAGHTHAVRRVIAGLAF